MKRRSRIAAIVLMMPFVTFAAEESAQTVSRPLVAPTEGAGTVTASAAKGVPAGLKVTGIKPARLAASRRQQRVVILGHGFTPGCRVALSKNGQIEVWPKDEVEFLSSRALAVNVITGEMAADWSVMVGEGRKRTSNMFSFTVTLPQVGQDMKGGSGEPVIREKTALSEGGNSEATRVGAATASGMAEREIYRSDWLIEQPEAHYTLQLLASNSSVNLMEFAHRHPKLTPLAAYTVARGGESLYVLTLGSYPTREAAEQAAKMLPEGVKPWVRSIASAKEHLLDEPAIKGSAAERPGEHIEVKDTAWVWSQNPHDYTIQLAAAESRQAIEAAMRQTRLSGELATIRTERGGKPWFVMVYGSFRGREAARISIERLPTELRKSNPWVRAFAGLQDELSKASP